MFVYHVKIMYGFMLLNYVHIETCYYPLLLYPVLLFYLIGVTKNMIIVVTLEIVD